MTSKEFSFIVFCSHDLLPDTACIRVVSVSTGKDVPLGDSSFLLRVSIDEDASILRCLIRHMASGRQAYVQSGTGLQAFIKACLLNDKGERTSSPEDLA